MHCHSLSLNGDQFFLNVFSFKVLQVIIKKFFDCLVIVYMQSCQKAIRFINGMIRGMWRRPTTEGSEAYSRRLKAQVLSMRWTADRESIS